MGYTDVSHMQIHTTPVLMDGVRNMWRRTKKGKIKRERMKDIYRVQVRGKAGSGKTCPDTPKPHMSGHTIQAALADKEFREHAILVASTGVAASMIHCRCDVCLLCSVHGITASSAFKLPVRSFRRRELSEDEKRRIGSHMVC